MTEKWEEIPEYPKYRISDQGRVKNVRTGKFLKPSKDKSGVFRVTLCEAGKCATQYIHRLVANVFLAEEPGKTIVKHKDENKENNSVSNLMWGYDQRQKAKDGLIRGGVVGYIEDGKLVPADTPRGKRLFG